MPKTTQNRTQDEPKFPTCPFLDPGGKREEKKRARGRGRGEKRREKKGEDKRTSRRECDFWSIFGSPCFPRTSWEPFEELLGLLGCLFGASWGSIGPSREALGRLLGALGGLLEASWGLLGRFGVPKTTQNRTQDEPKFPTFPFLDPGGFLFSNGSEKGKTRGGFWGAKNDPKSNPRRAKVPHVSFFGPWGFLGASWLPLGGSRGSLGSHLQSQKC